MQRFPNVRRSMQDIGGNHHIVMSQAKRLIGRGFGNIKQRRSQRWTLLMETLLPMHQKSPGKIGIAIFLDMLSIALQPGNNFCRRTPSACSNLQNPQLGSITCFQSRFNISRDRNRQRFIEVISHRVTLINSLHQLQR